MQSNPRHVTSRVIIKRMATSALIGLLYGLCFGLYLDPKYYGLGDWLLEGCIYGLVIGLSCWLLLTLMPRFSSQEVEVPATNPARRWKDLRRLIYMRYGQRVLLVTAVLGGGMGLSAGLYAELSPLLNVLNAGLIIGLRLGLYYGLLFGIVSVLLSLVLGAQAGEVHLTERLRWTWRSLIQSLFAPKHLRNSVWFASILLVLFGLSDALFYGLGLGLKNGLIFGLCAGLIFWLLLGLIQGISHELVEDKDRRVFNQGIRRSFRNSVIMGIISCAVIGVTGVLSAVLNYGLIYGLSFNGQIIWLIIDLGVGLREALFIVGHFDLQNRLLLAVSGGLLAWASFGGLAVLRHAALRLLLQRTHTFPLRAAPFLEDAKARILLLRVGGGYSFMHQLMLEYFVGFEKKNS